jgi:hypothetical protein
MALASARQDRNAMDGAHLTSSYGEKPESATFTVGELSGFAWLTYPRTRQSRPLPAGFDFGRGDAIIAASGLYMPADCGWSRTSRGSMPKSLRALTSDGCPEPAPGANYRSRV